MVDTDCFWKLAKVLLQGRVTLRDFREHFGVGPDVASATWQWLCAADVLPPKAKPIYLLWLFYWWKVYPTQGVIEKFLHVDKNTFNKWRDAMMVAVASLQVVRNAYCSCFFLFALTKFTARFSGKIDILMTMAAMPRFLLMEWTVLFESNLPSIPAIGPTR